MNAAKRTTNPDVVKVLIEAGADVNERDKWIYTVDKSSSRQQ